HAIGGCDINGVRMRGRHDENIGHRLALGILPGNRHPVRWNTHDFGTLECGKAKAFGKPAIVADVAADPPKGGVEYREAQIARREIERFITPEMSLAIAPDEAAWPDHDG